MEMEGGNELEDLLHQEGDEAKLQADQELVPAFQDEPVTWEYGLPISYRAISEMPPNQHSTHKSC